MNIFLKVSSPDGLNRGFSLSSGSHQIGNSDCEVALRYPTVSRQHATIIIGDNDVFFRDEGSKNGSFFGSTREPLKSGQAIQWDEGKSIEVGPFKLHWDLESPHAATQAPNSMRNANVLYERLLNENPDQACDILRERLKHEDQGFCNLVLDSIQREFHGDGPLQQYLDHPLCREILINSHDDIYVDLGRGLFKSEASFFNPATLERWVQRIVHRSGRRLDLQHPICEATLENGARFHAVLPPISNRGIAVAVRRFGNAPLTEDEAVASGLIDKETIEILRSAISRKLNIVISGGTSTGKTSLLNFLGRYLAPQERVITIEDTIELALPVANVVQLQARIANADGAGAISLRDLVQCALRMRPDRIIVGECRGDEVIEMLQALNTGHPGSLTTVHANSPSEALQRLELLALRGAPNLSLECVRQWLATSVDCIVHLLRDEKNNRHVNEIAIRQGDRLDPVYRRTG